MEQNILQEFIVKSRDLIDELDITDEEKSLVFYLVDALLRNDPDHVAELLTPVAGEKRLDILRTAMMVIDSLRLESENEIIEAGDLVQLERLAQLTELEDKTIGQVFDKILAEHKAKVGSPVPAA